METKSKPPKEKRRNNEKRKEKSRDAARSRRSRETEIFSDLANALPIPMEQISQLDKASIMRLAISYFKVRDMIQLMPTPNAGDSSSEDGSTLLKSLEGFAIALSPDGDIVYVTENVSNYLGIPQIDLMGQNIFEYSHPCDHDEIKEAISGKALDTPTNEIKSLFIRLKCTLTSKGRSVNLKSATYKVIHCTGHMVKASKKSLSSSSSSSSPSKDLIVEDDDDSNITTASAAGGSMAGCFLAVGQPIPHPSNIEAPLPRQTFLTKHSLDMKFIHADDEFMKDTLGYEPEDLLGKSVYEYHHAMDSDAILSAYKCLFSKGQCETPRYRFMAKNGGYVWVVTQATLLYDKIHKPQSIVSVNYVISGLECKDEIYAAFQKPLQQQQSVKQLLTTSSSVLVGGDANKNYINNINNNNVTTKIIVTTKVEEDDDVDLNEVNAAATEVNNNKCDNNNRQPISNTAKLFGALPAKKPPEDEEDDKEDILVIQEEEVEVIDAEVLEEGEEELEPEEETTTRPRINTLQIFGPRTKDMNKGFLTFSEEKPGLTMLKDEPDDLTHLAPVAGEVCVPLDDHPFLSDMLDDILLKDNFAPLLAEEPSDPFISYRDHDSSPQLLSPNLSKASDSLASLSSPSDSLLDEDHMSTFMTLHLEEESEMTLKAPYIPMEFTDDLPLLMPSELLWNGSEKKNKEHQQHYSLISATSDGGIVGGVENNSSLAHLLSTSLSNKHNSSSRSSNNHQQTVEMFSMKSTRKNNNWPTSPSKNTETTERTLHNINNSSNTTTTININNKRTHNNTNSSSYDQQQSSTQPPAKRAKSEPKEKMSSELLQQLMSNNHHRGRPKGRSNWLLDSGGQKAACISQPSDSVLMNLLDPTLAITATSDPLMDLSTAIEERKQREILIADERKEAIRKNSLSLLEPDGTCFASLMDLTQHDFEVNAPVHSLLLQGQELLSALDVNTTFS